MAPAAHGATRVSRPEPARRRRGRATAHVALQRTRFRGAWMNSANADVHLEKGALTFDNLRVTRDEGVGTGSFTYDFVKREVRLKEVKSTLRPTDAILWVEPKLFKDVAPYKFRQPPSIVANGVIHFGAPNDHLELTVDAPAGMDYVFLGKTLPVDRVSGRLLFTDNRLQLSEIAGKLFNGDRSRNGGHFPGERRPALSGERSRSRASISRAWPISISNTKPRVAA